MKTITVVEASDSVADPGALTPEAGANLLFGIIFAEDWMNMKEIGPGGGVPP